MNTHRHDWDREERAALAGLEDQLDAMRRRHVDDPPVEMLRAARADALPEDLQTSVSDFLATSAMSRTLAEGLGDDDAPALSREEQDRLLARIMNEAHDEAAPPSAWRWLRPLLVGSGIVAVASLVWMISTATEVGERLGPPETQVVVALPPAAPPFLLPFDKPDVRLGMGALTWRGSSPSTSDKGNQLLMDLKPGLDAYRQDDYETANRELTALAARYTSTIEVVFYQGVSRLFLEDYSGAIAAFETADAIGDRTFAADVSWYRAVAEQRSGNTAQARVRLEAICGARGPDAARACAALELMAGASARPR